jgi:hypothetical protein
MATDGEFVLTISDHEDNVLSSPDDFEIERAPPKAKKRKRGPEFQKVAATFPT